MDREWDVEVVAEALPGQELTDITRIEKFSDALRKLSPAVSVNGTASLRKVRMTISEASVSGAFIAAIVLVNRAGGESGFPRWPLKSMTVSRHDSQP